MVSPSACIGQPFMNISCGTLFLQVLAGYEKSFNCLKVISVCNSAGEWTDTIHNEANTRHLVEQLPSIQAVVLYLERKAKAPSTIEVYRKGLIELAKRA